MYHWAEHVLLQIVLLPSFLATFPERGALESYQASNSFSQVINLEPNPAFLGTEDGLLNPVIGSEHARILHENHLGLFDSFHQSWRNHPNYYDLAPELLITPYSPMYHEEYPPYVQQSMQGESSVPSQVPDSPFSLDPAPTTQDQQASHVGTSQSIITEPQRVRAVFENKNKNEGTLEGLVLSCSRVSRAKHKKVNS
ncbi:hypothetical protein O181_048628 [Austropuccinia psidii MF-1]|uniref:Uncharacterized protein n=1 Tax=Austropuccinia psidii MF-1 TaxID=1389203 RepID=A0A9Q3HKN6_9BASI|nr:hypothetical protein [Austropuccinia psidii MF-1]